MSEAGQTTTVAEPRDWTRAGFSLVFLILFSAGQALFTALAVVQLVWFLVKKAPNPTLQRFGPTVGQWLSDVSRFVFQETDEKPFPWAPWPAMKPLA